MKHEIVGMKHETVGNPFDLRAWLCDVEALGELKEVRGADWNLEIGAISELNVKKERPPALLFDEIAGYPKGLRVLTCSTSSPARLSSILRLPIQTTHRRLGHRPPRGRKRNDNERSEIRRSEVNETMATFKYLRSLPCDIFLAPLGTQYNLKAKYDNLGNGQNPFIDPQGYQTELDNWEKYFIANLSQQVKDATAGK